MSKVVLNNKEYDVPELTFNEVCRLEERGIYLLNMDPRDRGVATMLRGFVSWITDLGPEEASALLQAHIENGGRIDEIIEAVRKAFEESGFFGRGQQAQVRQIPQDHQRKKNKNRNGNTGTSPKS